MNTLRMAAVTFFAVLGSAWAQEPVPVPVPVPVPAPIVEPMYSPGPGYYRAPSYIGMEFLVGGGVTHFFDNTATSEVGPGGAWSARFDIGTRRHLGGELAYVGSAQPIFTGNNGQSSAALLSNGVETLVRWNILTGWVQPYAGVGIGYKHYSVLTQGEFSSNVQGVDNVVHIPAAVGLAFRSYGFVFDTRFAVSGPLDSHMIPGSSLTSWDLTAKIGYEF